MENFFRKRSLTGLVFVAIYLLLVAWAVFQAFTCNDIFCGFIILVLIMPWMFLLERFLSGSVFVYVFLVLVNVVISYSIGNGLEKVFKKIKSS